MKTAWSTMLLHTYLHGRACSRTFLQDSYQAKQQQDEHALQPLCNIFDILHVCTIACATSTAQSLMQDLVSYLQVALLLVNLGAEADLVGPGSLQSIAMPAGQAVPQDLLLGSGDDLHGDEHIQCIIHAAADVLLIILSASWRS